MNAAARVEGRDVVAGREELIRGGRGREGQGATIGAPRGSSYPPPRCVECGEEFPVEVDLPRIESVPYPEEPITFTSGGYAFELDWLSVQHEFDHAEGERKRLWGAADTPLLCIKTVNGERIGPKLILDLPGNVLDDVRRAVRLSIPLHRTEPDRPPVELEAPFDAIPVGGTATRIETWCRHCGARNVRPLEGFADFLLRGLKSLQG